MSEKILLGFSGGKDSLATALMMVEEGVAFEAVFSDTGNEHPLTIEYIDWINNNIFPVQTVKQTFDEEIINKRNGLLLKWEKQGVSDEILDSARKYLVPTGIPFLDLCLWKSMFPSSNSKFCTYQLKIRPMYEQIILPYLEQGYDVINVTGVRADESPSRENSPPFSIENDLNGALHIILNPILHYTTDDVFALSRKYGIQNNPLYTKGSTRVGCYPCIYANKDDIKEMGLRYPDEVARIGEWEKLVASCSKTGSATFFKPTKTCPTPTIENKVIWSKTKWGGVIEDPDLPTGDDVHACSSKYGLCG